MRTRVVSVILALVALALLVPIPIERNSQFWSALLDVGHIPLFAALTGLLCIANPLGLVIPGQRLIASALLSAFIALLIELLQPLSGREESITDLSYGAVGIAGACLLLRGRGFWAAAIFGLGGIIALQAPWREYSAITWRSKNFPVLADFEQSVAMPLWSIDDNPQFRRTPEKPAEGRFALRINVAPQKVANFLLRQDWTDWSHHAFVSFALFNEGPPFEFVVRIDDHRPPLAQSDIFHEIFRITPGWNRIRIPLSKVAANLHNRPLDLRTVNLIGFSARAGATEVVCHLDDLRLEAQ